MYNMGNMVLSLYHILIICVILVKALKHAKCAENTDNIITDQEEELSVRTQNAKALYT